MRSSATVGGLALAVVLAPIASFSFEPPTLARERDGSTPAAPSSCPIRTSQTGTCANYHWYNVCSGYIWLYTRWERGEAAGMRFGGLENPCVIPGNRVKRVITYFRDVFPGYSGCYDPNPNVEVTLDADFNNDGCPDQTIATTGCFDPSLRWNCADFNVVIPPGVSSLIVRQIKRGSMIEPAFATDGPYSQVCDPAGVARSYYYGINGSACIPWIGPTGRHDNFLSWLIVDGTVTATKTTTWGQIKGLFR